MGLALDRLISDLCLGAPTADLVAACETTLALLPVRTLDDAARVLDVEAAALEAEGCGRIWRIAVLDSVRDLLADLVRAGRSTAVRPTAADRELLLLEREWLALLAQVERGTGASQADADALWSALLAVADAPAQGLVGALVKLRVLVRVLADTATPESPEFRLLATTLAAVERLAAGLVAAEGVRKAAEVDALFTAAGHVMAPITPPPALIEDASRDTGLSALTVQRVYSTMMRLIGGNA
ncbi:hypothetical protein J2847_006475 [Azospirillum agricola]|uniref:hypothetical protein n=1 Tax=Azospirillum agricola TaxID=1720247 RepID=UPI001AE80134|nr:hypothetical protein [Azospirillum agricola]MBP2233140.1 hypothetical protein [Azospirillum agricola]